MSLDVEDVVIWACGGKNEIKYDILKQKMILCADGISKLTMDRVTDKQAGVNLTWTREMVFPVIIWGFKTKIRIRKDLFTSFN